MRITKELYEKLFRFSVKKFAGNIDLFNAISIFEPEDLLHSYLVSPRHERAENEYQEYENFKQFISRCVRDGERRLNAGKIINDSDNFVIDNFGDNYKEDDVLDGYVYRNSMLSDRVHISLYDYSYSDGRGNIDYDMMLEDIQKVMGRKDRLHCVKNRKSNRAYFVGNVNAIPLEMLYNNELYNPKERNLKDDGMG
jgi:hypothetical protein